VHTHGVEDAYGGADDRTRRFFDQANFHRVWIAGENVGSTDLVSAVREVLGFYELVKKILEAHVRDGLCTAHRSYLTAGARRNRSIEARSPHSGRNRGRPNLRRMVHPSELRSVAGY
jgi:hypothetical protein